MTALFFGGLLALILVEEAVRRGYRRLEDRLVDRVAERLLADAQKSRPAK